VPLTAPVSHGPRWFGWRGIGLYACGVAGSLAIAWFIFLSCGELGSKADWFFGAVVFCVVIVTMGQTVNIQRLARQDSAEAAERHRNELAAAEERAMRELAMTQRLHRTQMESQQRLHHAEMEAQRELARIERALNQVNEAALMAIRVAEDVYDAVVEGRAPEPNPIAPVQRLMHTRAAEARRLAWELLRSGLDDTRAATE
jgi:hypothetical protein